MSNLSASKTSPRTGGLIGTFLANSFGSDAVVSYSAEYAWLANQMAHAAMGFFIAGVWSLFIALELKQHEWLIAVPFVIVIIKDIIDYLLDSWRASDFELNRRELILDGFTDVFFWYVGMFTALGVYGWITEHDATWWIWVLICTTVIGVAGAAYFSFMLWLPQKRMFDKSRLPFNYTRLVRYVQPKITLGNKAVEQIRGFQLDLYNGVIGLGKPCKHYIIVGGDPVNRSALAVSMGCEFVARWCGVHAITATKLLEQPARLEELCSTRSPEDKKYVGCLIVDDLNVNLPIPGKDQESPHYAVEPMRQLHTQFDRLRDIYPVCTIWVLTGATGDNRLDAWKKYISRLVSGHEAEDDTLAKNDTITIEINHEESMICQRN